MNKQAAFLRGINISGKNAVSMPLLKAEMEAAGFSAVSTYLNSGNIVFEYTGNDARQQIEHILEEKFGLTIPVYVIGLDTLRDILSHAPSWWDTGNKEQYDNLIFILSSDTPEEICAALGSPSEGLEQIMVYDRVIFWTFERASYRKCSWWKNTARADIADKLTIRTANTLKKVCR